MIMQDSTADDGVMMNGYKINITASIPPVSVADTGIVVPFNTSVSIPVLSNDTDADIGGVVTSIT
jgi:hypothetical protein